MGNPDLIIVINKKAFLIKGTTYDTKDEAVKHAMQKFTLYQNEIDSSRRDSTGKLYDEADPNWFPEEIETIRIYEV